MPRRCGYGPPRPAPPRTTWTALAGISPPRSGAHLPLREAVLGLDHSETPHSRGCGPPDLDPDRRAHPTPPRPPAADLHGLCEKPNASGVQARSNSRRSPTRALQRGSPHGSRRGPALPTGNSLALSTMPSHTSCHTPVTNTVDAPVPLSANPREQHRIGPGGRQKTVLPTCARWCRGRAR